MNGFSFYAMRKLVQQVKEKTTLIIVKRDE